MARVSSKEKKELLFWVNEGGNIEYNKKCARCKNNCKQSYRTEVISCHKYKRR